MGRIAWGGTGEVPCSLQLHYNPAVPFSSFSDIIPILCFVSFRSPFSSSPSLFPLFFLVAPLPLLSSSFPPPPLISVFVPPPPFQPSSFSSSPSFSLFRLPVSLPPLLSLSFRYYLTPCLYPSLLLSLRSTCSSTISIFLFVFPSSFLSSSPSPSYFSLFPFSIPLPSTVFVCVLRGSILQPHVCCWGIIACK